MTKATETMRIEPSAFMFDCCRIKDRFDSRFVLGAALTLAATYIYSTAPAPAPPKGSRAPRRARRGGRGRSAGAESESQACVSEEPAVAVWSAWRARGRRGERRERN